jgi:hypothetical protein
MKKKLIVLSFISIITIMMISCDKENPTTFDVKSNDRFPIIVTNANFTTPGVSGAGTTQVSKGATIKVELNYQQTDPIKEIQFLQKIDLADSTVIFQKDYVPSFSKTKNADTLVYDYIVPSTPPVGATIVVRGRVLNQNGYFRDRFFSFKVR